MVTIGLAILLLSLLSISVGLLGTKGYSALTLTMGYIGLLLLTIGASNLLARKSIFFTTIFLSATALYGITLFRYEVRGDVLPHPLSVLPETTVLFVIIIGLSYAILKLKSTLSNRRKLYQTFSLVMFNLGALGIVAKHLIAPGLHCYACPWATAGCPIGLIQNWVIMGDVPYYLFGSFFALYTVIGRAFCGWACPFGFLHDVIDKVTEVKFTRKHTSSALRRVFVAPFRKDEAGMPHEAVRRHRDNIGILTYFTRSAVFVAMIVTAWKLVDTWFCKFCPAGLLEAAFPYRVIHNVFPDPLYVIRIIIFVSLILLAVVISRYWCRYFCPLGHLAGHFNHISLLRLHLDPERCTNCGLCRKACPMELDPVAFLSKTGDMSTPVKKVVNTIKNEQTNCILCGECVEACKSREGALSLSFDFVRRGKRATQKIEEEEYEAYEAPRIAAAPRPAKPTGIPVSTAPETLQESTYERPWPIAVSIKAYYKSYTDMPRLLARLEETAGYSLERYDIYKDEAAADYFSKVYKGHARTPVIVVNGQVYTGSINDVSGLLTFLRTVQETYQEIYMSCFAGRCRNCRSKGCMRFTGGLELESQRSYHFGMFYASSPGELMASCEMGALWAHYGKPLHEHMLFIDHPKSNALLYAKKASEFIDELRELPITTIELYLKKDSELSEDILNIIALASHYSGGKLRYTITQWDERTPGVYIDGTKVPSAYHPSSFTTLLSAIKRYAR